MIINDTTFVSISDLRDKTSSVVKDLAVVGKKIILSQNKPTCILLSVEEYNNMLKLSFPKEKATQEDIQAYKKSSHGKQTVDAFEFLAWL